MHDSRNLPNDEFGYSAYTVVAHADPKQVIQINEVRSAIGLTRATIDAHVTIRGTFFAIQSLDEMRDRIRRAASKNHPVPVSFSSEGWKDYTAKDGRHTTLMHCDTAPELLALHTAFDEVIRPHSKNAYPDNYMAHLTLCQDCTDEQIEKAHALASKLDIGTGFDIRSVKLMGRIGPAFGGEWTEVDSFPLGQ